jgi:hypothetical protein
MKKYYLFLIFIFIGGCSVHQTEHNHSQYAGQEKREIKALSDEEKQNYLEGNGMGFAKAAELNGFPGPKHILENEADLDLSSEQKKAVEKSFQTMKTKAVDLGELIVKKEKELDQIFENGNINDELLKEKTREIAELQGDLRNTHLLAHLEMKKLLSTEQVTKYKKIRGYTN